VIDALVVVGMLFSLILVFSLVYYKTGSVRYGAIVMLVIGHFWAIILHVYGYDVTLFYFLVILKQRGEVIRIPVTADSLILESFFVSLVISLVFPYIEDKLPEPLRRLEMVR